MLTNNNLRKKIQVLSKEKGLEFIDRALLVNDAFSRGFNRSIGEEPIIRYFGQYNSADITDRVAKIIKSLK